MSSSITAEEARKRIGSSMTAPDTVTVKIGVALLNGIPIPVDDEYAERYEEAVFKRMKVGDNRAVTRVVEYKVEREDGKEISSIDVVEYKRVVLRKNLLSWTLPVELERENGWLTDACYERIAKMPAPLVDAIIEKYDDTMIITREEEALIDKQAAVLFGKNSRGVADACEAVSLYCTLTSFWEKFGIGLGTSLDEMDYLDYQRLKIMSAKDAEASRQSASVAKKPVTKIASGGRTRQSRGVVVG